MLFGYTNNFETLAITILCLISITVVLQIIYMVLGHKLNKFNKDIKARKDYDTKLLYLKLFFRTITTYETDIIKWLDTTNEDSLFDKTITLGDFTIIVSIRKSEIKSILKKSADEESYDFVYEHITPKDILFITEDMRELLRLMDEHMMQILRKAAEIK